MNSRGASHPFAMLAGISMIIVGVLVGIICYEPGAGASGPRKLILFCAPAMNTKSGGPDGVIDIIAREYRARYNVEIQIDSGPSEALLTRIKIASVGDLFLPADDSYLNAARKDNLIDESIPLVRMHPVIAVKKGNPKNIHSTRDFLRSDVTVALANTSAAIGKLAKELMQSSGEWSEIEKQQAEFKNKISDVGTVIEAANAVKIGSADATVVWDSTVAQFSDIEAVEQDNFKTAGKQADIAVLHCSRQPTEALRFARYVAARDRGLLEFQKKGYTVVDGDEWADRPQLTFFAGAMLRPAIEETLKEFEQREGLPPISTTYDGCGILVSQMRTKVRPDGYISCDASFMSQVQNLFEKPQTLAANKMVIVVRKGNPKGIHSLRDLTQPGLRIGIGNEQTCALGFLTKGVMDRQQICEAVEKNIRDYNGMHANTGDQLLTGIAKGPLDAVVVYESNATFVKDQLDVIPVDLTQQFATQPIAVGKTTKYKHLMERLVQALRSPKSAERFKADGFQWLADQK